MGQNSEVSDLCRLLVGKWAEVVAKIFSLVVLIGANIVYWVLMSNFLYNSVLYIHGYVLGLNEETNYNETVICPKGIVLNISQTNVIPPSNLQETPTLFDQYWDLNSTVPVLLGIMMFPLLNFRSPTFFTKFNSLGTLSVIYLLVFVALKGVNWGINMPNWEREFHLQPTFCALSGMLSLSYFIHNIIISIMKNNRYKENNGRDLSFAFGLVTFTYIFIGAVFYITFPLAKTCIEDNILNNFPKSDMLTVVARLLLLFQLFTVFPLISYMLRLDILNNLTSVFKKKVEYLTYKVVIINIVIITVCILFACFLPKIGTLIRYTGAMSGLFYIFLLPSLLKIASLRKENALTPAKLIMYIIIIIIGVLNLCFQFFIEDQ